MKARIEVSRILLTSKKEYNEKLERQGNTRAPISAFSNDSEPVYLKCFLWDQGGVDPSNGNTFIATEDSINYAAYTHGVGAMEKHLYIVARPTAIILPEAGVTNEDYIILLDMYEEENGYILPHLPKHCKNVMLLRLYVMLNLDLLQIKG